MPLHISLLKRPVWQMAEDWKVKRGILNAKLLNIWEVLKQIGEEERRVNICRCHWLLFILTWQSTLPCEWAKGILISIEYITREDVRPFPVIPAQMIHLPHPQAMSSLVVMEVINVHTNTICAEARLMSKVSRGRQRADGVRGEGDVVRFNSKQSRGGPSS